MKLNYSYNTFGLKEEWINNFLIDFNDFFKNLGPRQIVALENYLKHCELIKSEKSNEFYCYSIKMLKNKNIFWSYLLINLFFNSGLFIFYQYVSNGLYSSEQLFRLLKGDYCNNYENRTCKNAINSLISTLEYTPIGSELKIGIVWREKNKRFVKKEGGYPFDPYVILYALYKYAQKNQIYEIDIDKIENEICSPQKVLVIDTKYVKNALLELNEHDMIKTNVNEENHLIVTLNNQFHPYDVIRKYIEKE